MLEEQDTTTGPWAQQVVAVQAPWEQVSQPTWVMEARVAQALCITVHITAVEAEAPKAVHIGGHHITVVQVELEEEASEQALRTVY
jgi:hypothetical protein